MVLVFSLGIVSYISYSPASLFKTLSVYHINLFGLKHRLAVWLPPCSQRTTKIHLLSFISQQNIPCHIVHRATVYSFSCAVTHSSSLHPVSSRVYLCGAGTWTCFFIHVSYSVFVTVSSLLNRNTRQLDVFTAKICIYRNETLWSMRYKKIN